jgi:hypothetical protein
VSNARVTTIRTRAIAAVLLAGCVARDAESGESSTAEGATGSVPIAVEDCDRIASRAECEAAVVDHVDSQDRCVWIDVRRPEPTCASDVVLPQCVGVEYVGDGCQTFSCSEGPDVDGMFRMVDGVIEVLANPECGLVAVGGWTACEDDGPAECACLCE